MKKFTLTVPEEVYEYIKKKANQKGISVNEYIILLISRDEN